MALINFVTLTQYVVVCVLCIGYNFVDRRNCFNHDGSIMTGNADEYKNDHFKDFTVTAPHFKTIKIGGEN